MNRGHQSDRRWKTGTTLVLVLALLNILALILWLVIFYQRYEAIAKVVAGVWAALTTFLAFLKVKHRQTSLLSFLDLAPVKAIILVFTVINLVAIYAFILWHYPVHKVVVAATIAGQPGDGTLITWNGVEKGRTDSAGQLVFHIPGGAHDFSAQRRNYGEKKLQKVFVWLKWTLPIRFDFVTADRQTGLLVLVTTPEKVKIDLQEANGQPVVGKTGLETDTPYLTELPVGEYTLQLSRPGYGTMIRSVRIVPGDTCRLAVSLSPGRGSLRIRSELNQADIYLDNQKLNQVTPATLTGLAVGVHTIRLIKRDDEATNYRHRAQKEVLIRADQTQTVIFTSSDFKTEEIQ